MKKLRIKQHRNYLLINCVLAVFVMVSLSFNTDQSTCNNGKYTLKDNTIEKSIKVAGVKMMVSNDIPTNVESIKKAIDFAKKEKADILLTSTLR